MERTKITTECKFKAVVGKDGKFHYFGQRSDGRQTKISKKSFDKNANDSTSRQKQYDNSGNLIYYECTFTEYPLIFGFNPYTQQVLDNNEAKSKHTEVQPNTRLGCGLLLIAIIISIAVIVLF